MAFPRRGAVNPAEVLTRLKTLGIRAEVRDGRLITRRPPDVVIPPDLAAAIRAHKAEIIRLLTGPDPETRCVGCGASLEPAEVPAGVCGDCAQAPVGPEDFHWLVEACPAGKEGRLKERLASADL